MVDLSLKGQGVTGTIYQPGGSTPAVGVDVSLLDPDMYYDIVGMDTTAADGSYYVAVDTPGTYVLEALVPDDKSWTAPDRVLATPSALCRTARS